METQKEVKQIRKGDDDQSGTDGVINVTESEISGSVEIEFKDGEKAESDYVIVATGSEPNVDLAKHLKLEVDPVLGGVTANSQLETISGVYAAGDVCSYYDRVLGLRRRTEHGDNASYQGQVAGHNMSAPTLI